MPNRAQHCHGFLIKIYCVFGGSKTLITLVFWRAIWKVKVKVSTYAVSNYILKSSPQRWAYLCLSLCVLTSSTCCYTIVLLFNLLLSSQEPEAVFKDTRHIIYHVGPMFRACHNYMTMLFELVGTTVGIVMFSYFRHNLLFILQW